MNTQLPVETAEKDAGRVRAMFGVIAHRYDFLNHFLSFNSDRRWRRFAVRQIAERIGRRTFDALDLACGTADLTLALRDVGTGRVIGLDFCHPMLVVGLNKMRRRNSEQRATLAEADVLHLPLRDGSFDVVSIAFGLRNLEDYDQGMREMRRVLRPGGVVAVLEFSQPTSPRFRSLYQFYFHRILPRIGTLVSGVSGPYAYLPESVATFPNQEELKSMMESAGFTRVDYFNLSGGIAALHLGTREE
jgi:demethylmenaquinone methyltransferase/2-methoxy-6-polyprenyl-1,4-benzoquinol methylase